MQLANLPLLLHLIDNLPSLSLAPPIALLIALNQLLGRQVAVAVEVAAHPVVEVVAPVVQGVGDLGVGFAGAAEGEDFGRRRDALPTEVIGRLFAVEVGFAVGAEGGEVAV